MNNINGFRVYDTKQKKHVTDVVDWVITPDGNLYYINCDEWCEDNDCSVEFNTGFTPSDIVDLRNYACQLCGKYKTEHLGSCNKCRWKKRE